MLAFVFRYPNLGAVHSPCRYNSATGWSRIVGTHMRVAAVILVDQDPIRPGAAVAAEYRPTAFVAWAIGSAVGLVVESAAPQYSTALCSMVVGGVAYWALSAFGKPATRTA